MYGIPKKADLSVDFCGLRFQNPFILSAGPPTTKCEMIKRAFDVGWGGAVVKTFRTEPTPNVSPRFANLPFEDKKMVGFVNVELSSEFPLEDELPKIKEVKKEYPDNILIVSLMAGMNPSDWQEMTRKVQDVGADMVELALWCPGEKTALSVGQDSESTRNVVKWVKEVADVPVMVKLAQNVTDITSIAKAAEMGGADAVTATDTVPCFLGVDLEKMAPKPSVNGMSTFGGYSGPAIKPLVLRCVAQIAKSTKLPISGVGGISTWEDAAEFIMVGASTVQLCTAVMFGGYRIIDDLKEGLSNYLMDKGFGSVSDIVGHALPKITETVEDLDLAHKVVPEIDKSKCIKDDLCYLACRDAGYQAIELDKERLPIVDDEKCIGCSLCSLVCPVWDCIKMKRKQK